jgi:hypothetical protein
MSETHDVVARFHRTLVEEIRERRPEYLSGPFTVAEIYQNLVPYGSHRDLIGVEMNGDYEDALLRLLAGEGGYLILESGPALRALREELESSNPNTGLYREFAAVDVRLDPAHAPAGGGGTPTSQSSGSAPAAEPAESGFFSPAADAAPAEDPVAPAEPVSMADLAPSNGGASAAPGGDVPDACRWCRAELPQREDLNFCPFCGTDIHVVPCPGCGQELEPEWRFCIACGTEVAP